MSRTFKTFAGVPLLILANFYLRHSLEHAGLYLYDFLDRWYAAGVATVFGGHYPWWKFLLPIEEFQGSWTATTLVLTHVVSRWLGGAARAWYVYHAILILVSFATSWLVFRSRTFSYTFAFCMGFGTQLYHTYSVSGGIALVLLPVYFELLLFCAYRIVTATDRAIPYRFGFAAMALVTALSYEAWLDLLVFAGLAVPLLAAALWWARRFVEAKRVLALAGVMMIVGVAYVFIKTRVGYAQVGGSESDVVFNYPVLAPKLEDVASNALTHLYIVLTNFLPPVFLSSTALYELGGRQLIAYQDGYHAPFSYLVPMHYLFLWRYAAGAAAVLFLQALFLAGRAMWRRPDRDTIALTLFLLMIAVGGPTHALVKIRPMKTAPLLAYHAPVGVMGMALLIAYGLMRARRDMADPRTSGAVIVCAWAVMSYACLARPAMLDHLAAQVGLGEGQYPDPWQAIVQKLGVDTRRTRGAALFQLQPVTSSDEAASATSTDAGLLPALANPLPSWAAWRPSAGIRADVAGNALQVRGDASEVGLQLKSPPIAVRTAEDIALRLQLRVDGGRICAGVLDAAERRWLLAPELLRQEYVFNTGANDRVTIAITNCNRRITENERSVFTVLGGSYEGRATAAR